MKPYLQKESRQGGGDKKTTSITKPQGEGGGQW